MSDEIPEDLMQKLAAMKNVVNAHELIAVSSFPGGSAERVLLAIKFLTALHEQILKEAKQHDKAHLVPELGVSP